MITTTDLSIQYSGEQVRLPDLDIKQGEHTLLLGASGTGKTSLLLCLAGLLKPASGNVTIKDQNLYALLEAARDQYRAGHIGIVFQTLHLLPDLTVQQNISLAAKSDSQLVTKLGIDHLLNRKPDQLSQGQAQRVAIARALVSNPAVLLADEPTSALDDDNAKIVTELLLDMAQQHNSTLLIATHDQRLKPYFTKQVQL